MIKKKNKLSINKDGFRKDLDDYFSRYMFTNKKQISPFIVVDKTNIYCLKHTYDLVTLQKDITIFHTWPGKYRSDVFVWTIGEMYEWIEKQPDIDFYYDRLRGMIW